MTFNKRTLALLGVVVASLLLAKGLEDAIVSFIGPVSWYYYVILGLVMFAFLRKPIGC